jgi:hypothetical protein
MYYLAILFPIHTKNRKTLNALKRKVMYLLANQNDMAQGAGAGVGGNKAVCNGRSHNLEEFKVTFHFLSVPRKLYFIENFLVEVPHLTTSAVHGHHIYILRSQFLNIKHTRNIF